MAGNLGHASATVKYHHPSCTIDALALTVFELGTEGENSNIFVLLRMLSGAI